MFEVSNWNYIKLVIQAKLKRKGKQSTFQEAHQTNKTRPVIKLSYNYDFQRKARVEGHLESFCVTFHTDFDISSLSPPIASSFVKSGEREHRGIIKFAESCASVLGSLIRLGDKWSHNSPPYGRHSAWTIIHLSRTFLALHRATSINECDGEFGLEETTMILSMKYQSSAGGGVCVVNSQRACEAFNWVVDPVLRGHSIRQWTKPLRAIMKVETSRALH